MEIEGPIQSMVSHGEPICITKAQGNTLNKLVIACENGNLLETKVGKLENWKKSTESSGAQKAMAKLSVAALQNSNSNSNSDFGIKAIASTWNSTQGTQIAILQQSFITGEYVINIHILSYRIFCQKSGRITGRLIVLMDIQAEYCP